MTKEQKVQFIESFYDQIATAGSISALVKLAERLKTFVGTWYPNDPIRTQVITKQADIQSIRNDEIDGIYSAAVMSQRRNKWTNEFLNLVGAVKELIQNDLTPDITVPAESPALARPPATNSDIKNILFISSNPPNMPALFASTEANTIELAQQRKANDNQPFLIIQKGEIQKRQLSRFVRQNNPYILHIVAHVDKTNGIIFRDHNQQPTYLDANDLLHIIKQQINRQQPIKCLLLNSCYTKALAEACKDYVDVIIYLDGCTGSTDFMRFTEGFYTYLFDEENFQAAFDEGVYFVQKDEQKALYKLLIKNP